MPFLVDERLRSRLALFHDEFVERGVDGGGGDESRWNRANKIRLPVFRSRAPFLQRQDNRDYRRRDISGFLPSTSGSQSTFADRENRCRNDKRTGAADSS